MKRVLPALIAIIVLLIAALPVSAQVPYPDIRFTIDQIEVYANYLELGDQLYIITATIDNTDTPDLGVDQTYIVRLLNGGVELGTATFYPYFDNGYSQGIASIYFSAATAPAWMGAYDVQVTGNPALDWTDPTATHSVLYALSYDAGLGTYTDQTTEANNATANDMDIWTTEVGDAYYFGSDGPFTILKANVGTAGSWTGTYVYEYWDGTNWTSVTNLNDDTTGFTVAGNNNISWDAIENWQQNTVDGKTAYWVRFYVDAWTAKVTDAKGTQVWTNKRDNPPSITSNVFSLWYDDGTLVGTSERLTTRVRSIATTLESKWGGTTDLVENVAGVQKLTDEGETYFVNSIANLRQVCPDLFASVIYNPDFSQSFVVQDSNYAGADSIEQVYGVNWFAQTYTASDDYELSGLRIYTYRVGTPGTLTVSLRAVAAGLPSGADLVSGTFDADTMSTDTSGAFYVIPFTDLYTVSSGTTYAFVVRATAGNVNNYVAWIDDSTTSTYTGGQECSSVNSGVAWAASATQDFIFQALAFGQHNLSYRDQLAQTLVGTPLDMTNLGNNLGMSRMWTTFIVFMLANITMAVYAARAVRNYKIVTPFLALCMGIEPLAGIMYLEVGLTFAFLLALATVYVFFFRGAS